MTKKQTAPWKRLTNVLQIRFGLVGTLNTTVDYVVLFTLVFLLGIPSMLANIASTSAALTVSFFMNRRVVFGDTSPKTTRQFLKFVLVTLIGLWLIQGIIIASVPTVLWMLVDLPDGVALFIAKLVATLATLVWNYNWYSKVIFKQKKK